MIFNRFCTKCGAQLTEGVKFCESCGAPVEETRQPMGNMTEGNLQMGNGSVDNMPISNSSFQNQNPQKKKLNGCLIAILVCIGVVILLCVAVSSCRADESETQKTSSSSSQKDEKTTPKEEAKESTVESSKEETVEEPKEEKKEFVNPAAAIDLFAGDFTVGVDITAGMYDITTPEGIGNITITTEKGMPININMLTSSSEQSFGLGVTKIHAYLFNDYTISISGLNTVNLVPADLSPKTELTSGQYLVGLEIVPGTYIASAPDGGFGNFNVTRNGMPIVYEMLGKDDVMGLGVEKVKFTAKEGDYIDISGLNRVTLTQ